MITDITKAKQIIERYLKTKDIAFVFPANVNFRITA